MSEPVRVYIERMKSLFGVKTDLELAEHLGCSKQAIANWRRRDTIPFSVEADLVQKYGSVFARSEVLLGISKAQEKQVSHAAATYCLHKFLSRLDEPIPVHTVASLGNVLPILIEEFRRLLYFEEYDAPVGDILTSLEKKQQNGQLPEVDRILAQIDLRTSPLPKGSA
ncbi:helix-turn-helix domain-containing protein [Roseibium sp.]|uniref:helix-turn-helix domain-containing protein n=1 Tax=Roseibium sp. TaxID=1936156 RepID=UPI003A988131